MKPVGIQALKRISVINAETGIELYNQDFGTNFYLEHDNQLISGFISALIGFSKTIVKDEIQEIVFANSKLFVQRFQKVIIVVMATLRSDRFQIQTIISNLNDQIESQIEISNKIVVISQETVSILGNIITKLINSVSESKNQFSKPIKHPKIVIAGLKQAGKTTTIHKFFYSWNKDRLKDIKPTVDYSIFHSFLDFLSTELTIFDLGGQSQYIDNHLKAETKWKEAAAIIFMVDISLPEEFPDAFDYLQQIIKILHENDEEPFIGLFVHKYDPDKATALRENVQTFLTEFRGIFSWPKYSIFLTSIFDESLHLAFMRTLSRIIPRGLFKTILESAIFFETRNQVWLTISEKFNLKSKEQTYYKQIIELAIPYGEKLANEILNEWIVSGNKASLKEMQEKKLNVSVDDIQGGLRIKVEFQDQTNHLLSISVIEGLFTGLGNFFGLSNVTMIDQGKTSDFSYVTWGLYEF